MIVRAGVVLSSTFVNGLIVKRQRQPRRRLRKRHLKMNSRYFKTLSRLFHLVQFVKCWQFFLELNFKRLYRSSGK